MMPQLRFFVGTTTISSKPASSHFLTLPSTSDYEPRCREPVGSRGLSPERPRYSPTTAEPAASSSSRFKDSTTAQLSSSPTTAEPHVSAFISSLSWSSRTAWSRAICARIATGSEGISGSWTGSVANHYRANPELGDFKPFGSGDILWATAGARAEIPVSIYLK